MSLLGNFSLKLINHSKSQDSKRVFARFRRISVAIHKPYHLQKILHENEFMGMVSEDLDYHILSGVVEKLAIETRQSLTPDEKQFLMSLASGKPNWELMSFTHLKELPALQWKLLNINNMDAEKRKLQISTLETLF